jgi:lysophospholipase L1-like esterase
LAQHGGGSPLSPDIKLAIDFNTQHMPGLLGLDVPADAAAAILGISPEQFKEYATAVENDVRQAAGDLLSDPLMASAIDRLPVPPGGTLLILGDSITAYRRGYAEILRAMLDLRRPDDAILVLNLAESGFTSAAGLEVTYTRCLAQPIDFVLIMLGVNDCKRFGNGSGGPLVSLTEYRRNMAAIVSAFAEQTAALLVLLTPTPIPESLVNSYPDFVTMALGFDNADIAACADALKSIAAEAAVPLVDLVSLFGSEPDPGLYTPEGLHPGPQGHRLIVGELLRVIDAMVTA